MSNHELDQEWAEARDWVHDLDPETTLGLYNLLSADDTSPLVKTMQDHPAIATCVQMLALTALKEASSRLIDLYRDNVDADKEADQ